MGRRGAPHLKRMSAVGRHRSASGMVKIVVNRRSSVHGRHTDCWLRSHEAESRVNTDASNRARKLVCTLPDVISSSVQATKGSDEERPI